MSIKPFNYNSQSEYEAALVAAAAEQARKAAAAEWQAAEQSRRLANLHKEVGFDSIKELIDALRELTPAGAKAAGKAPKAGRRPRATITDELRAKVKAAAAAGKKAPTIAKELGLSAPSVYNILKA